MKEKFTVPELCPKNPTAADMHKEWRVRFRYLDELTGKLIPVARKGGINAYHTYKERLREAQALKKAFLYKLRQQGWNPLTNTYDLDTASTQANLSRLKYFSFNEAIDFAYEKKKADWSEETPSDYKSAKKILKQAANDLGLGGMTVADFELPHYRSIIDKVAETRKLGAAGYNKYRDRLSALVTEMKQWNIVKVNYVGDVKSKIKSKTVAHRPPTEDERRQIVSTIKEANFNYYIFLCVEYGCTMRPKDIFGLKISDFKKSLGIFRIRSEAVKDRTERDVAIPNWLFSLLDQLNLESYPPEYYIFSGTPQKRPFLPGARRSTRRMSTSIWKTIVKDGLKLDNNQYGLKKLAGNDLIKIQKQTGAYNLLELPRIQMGHSTTRQTEVYVTEHHEVLKELVQNSMPVL